MRRWLRSISRDETPKAGSPPKRRSPSAEGKESKTSRAVETPSESTGSPVPTQKPPKEPAATPKTSRGSQPLQGRPSSLKPRSQRSLTLSQISPSSRAQLSLESFHQPDKPLPPLSYKDLLFIFVQMTMTYSSHLIRKRKSDAHEYHSQLGKTRREIEIELLFAQGWAAIGSLLAGVLADGYVGTFYVAFSSIINIFVMATFLYAEQILILRMSFNPYADVFTEVATVVHLLDHSIGIYRVVFGLENMRNKKPSAVYFLLFIFTFTGDAPNSGGIIRAIADGARLNTLSLVRLSWWSSMISVVIFMAFFKSIAQDNTYRLTSRRAIRCVLEWVWHFSTHWCTKIHWEHQMYRKYDRATLSRARGLIYYTFLLLPIVGFIFFTAGKVENLYSRLPQVAKPSGLHDYIGSKPGWALTILLTMLLAYFVLIPLMAHFGVPKKFSFHFSLGYFFALCSMYYLALIVKFTDPHYYDGEIGYIRIYNSRDRNTTLFALDRTAAQAKLTIPPKSAVMGAYVISGKQLLPTMVKFDETTNFTTFIKAQPKKCHFYVLVDPPEMIRMVEEVPLFEGPPLTNDYDKPRLYLFNAQRNTPKRSVQFKELATGKIVLTLESLLGETKIFQVPPGNYELWVEGTELRYNKHFNDGGIYGVLLLASLSHSLLELDEVIPGKEISSHVFTVFAALYGMALTFGYVTLLTMTYKKAKAPNGLLNTSFGILAAQENLTVWVLVVGYHTWHELLLGDTLLTYCVVLTFLFLLSIFVMTKYNDLYD